MLMAAAQHPEWYEMAPFLVTVKKTFSKNRMMLVESIQNRMM